MSKTGLNKESTLNEIVDYWKEISKKHAPQEFIGQLSLLKEPLSEYHGEYELETFCDLLFFPSGRETVCQRKF